MGTVLKGVLYREVRNLRPICVRYHDSVRQPSYLLSLLPG